MRSLARAATLRKREAFKVFKAEIGADMATIEAYAKATRDPGVRSRAGLWARKRASRQHPITPTQLRLRFDVKLGAMVLTWKGRTRPGTIYQIERRLTPAAGHDGRFHIVAAIGQRRYEDASIPPGTIQAEYVVSATKNGRTVRSLSVGATLHGEGWAQWAGAAPLTAHSARSA